MPEPTATEKTIIKEMFRMAERFDSGDVTEKDRDRAQSIMLRFWATEHGEGVISVPECAAFRETLTHNNHWNLNKAVAVILATLTACGSVVTLVLKLT